MTCANAALPLVVAIVILLLALVGVAAFLVRQRAQDDAGPTDFRASEWLADQSPAEVRRMRAGPVSPLPAPDPALTVARATAIEQDARAAARLDFKQDPKHRRGNPHRRNSREAAVWGLNYAEEWDQLANPAPLDCSDEAPTFAPTQPGHFHGAA